MGITNLLPNLRSATTAVSLDDLDGKILAVDGFSWLHQSVFICPEELSLNLPTNNYIKFLEKRIMTLLSYNVQIYIFFD